MDSEFERGDLLVGSVAVNRDVTPAKLKREIAALSRIAAEPDGSLLEDHIAGRISAETITSLLRQNLLGVRLDGAHALASRKRYFITDAGRTALASVTVRWL